MVWNYFLLPSSASLWARFQVLGILCFIVDNLFSSLSLRPQVPGAIGGPQLGEAAHRLLANTLNIKHRNPHQSRNSPSNTFMSPRPRPAGPTGYERGYYDDMNHNHRHQNAPRGVAIGPRFPHSDPRNQNLNHLIKNNSPHREQHRDLRDAVATMGLEDGRARPWAQNRPRAPNGSFPTSQQNHNFVQNRNPPPVKWFNRGPGGGGNYRQQEASSVQAKQIYQVKTREQRNNAGAGANAQS